ncbi:hypothetical protein [Acinetobacter sp. SA01]|uniref:hypothetical protein n=1 Tax=Acinetobacter sp. SA01 TaxID=1862567 RepID=UPI001F0DF9BF|nr:hypothetical protein [Acinetobacter sp. SA01]
MDIQEKQAQWALEKPLFEAEFIHSHLLPFFNFNENTGDYEIKSEFVDDEDKELAFEVLNTGWVMWLRAKRAKAKAVPEGFGLFDGDTLTYSNGYSINCSFDDEFDCHVFDVSKDGCYIKTGMTQLEQAHCLVLSMIKLDSKDSTLEAQEPAND